METLRAAAAGLAGLVGLGALAGGPLPTVTAADTPRNAALLEACPTLRRPYLAPPGLGNPHVVTIFAALARVAPAIAYRREVVPSAGCGGVFTLDWPLWGGPADAAAVPPAPPGAAPPAALAPGPAPAAVAAAAALLGGAPPPPPGSPIWILLPGLTGGSGDAYVRCLILAAAKLGHRSVVFNSRGCADSPVTSPQFYSASFTEDVRQVVALVRERNPGAPLVGVGWSLGANILLRYLGEEAEAAAASRAGGGAGVAAFAGGGPRGAPGGGPAPGALGRSPMAAAVSLCNPFDLPLADRHFQLGFNRFYDHRLASQLRSIIGKHKPVFQTAPPPLDPPKAFAAKTIREFDEALTAPCFGWESVDAYYAGSSSAKMVPSLAVPTLCVQAEDDPIAPAAGIPTAALRANPHTVLVTTPAGGHLGWVAGPGGVFGEPWTDTLITEYVSHVLGRGVAGEA